MRGLWQLWSAALPDDVVEDIKTTAIKYPEKEASIGQVENSRLDTKIRRSSTRWIPTQEAQKITEICWSFFQHANRNCFGFDITQLYDLQYTEYHAENKGFYDEHTDVLMGEGEMSHRKLSMTIQLSDSEDYEGGDFVFNLNQIGQNPDKEQLRKKGTVLVFPSFVMHGVKPVTKGTRKSLVTWVEGPTWR